MQRNNRLAKGIILSILAMLSIFGVSSFAANPSFSISPASGTVMKLYCKYSFGIYLNPGGLSYNGFDATIKFNTGEAMITHASVNPFFTEMATGFIANGNLYRTYGGSPSSNALALTAATFIFKTTAYIWSTFLWFTTRTGSTIVFNQNTTDDGATINSSISSLDMLTGITDAWYTFVALPCIVDTTAPQFSSVYPNNNARYISDWAIISFLTYDWIGSQTVGLNSTQHYRYAWGATIPANYQQAPSTVDNQEWVDSTTIKATVSCPTCVGSWTHILTWSRLSITPRTGDAQKNRYTRDSENRWYAVHFAPPAPYEIEKEITVILEAKDNPNENFVTHTNTYSFSFNAPSTPTITRISPATSTNVDTRTNPFVFHIEDDRAGIDPNTISITIPAILSWSTVLYTGYTYSWSDLMITLIHGSTGIGNSWWYEVAFTGKWVLPSNTAIQITWSAYDYAGNQWTYAGSFTTKKSCADWWCVDTFWLNILWWTFAGNNIFSGTLIIITGTNNSSIYPYITWDNNDILMCGLPYTGMILTGNIWIYDTNGLSINGTSFTGATLYITGMDGLDFILDNDQIRIQ